MYKLDRTRKCKIVFIILTLLFFILPFIAAACGAQQHTTRIILTVSPLLGIVCLGITCLAHSLEKDIADWLGILEDRLNNKK